jgi:hypothetical protein
MKLIFDQYSVPSWLALSTVKDKQNPSIAVLSTGMDEVMRLPWQYSLLASIEYTKGFTE